MIKFNIKFIISFRNISKITVKLKDNDLVIDLGNDSNLAIKSPVLTQ